MREVIHFHVLIKSPQGSCAICGLYAMITVGDLYGKYFTNQKTSSIEEL